jgi:hypothetical protein
MKLLTAGHIRQNLQGYNRLRGSACLPVSVLGTGAKLNSYNMRFEVVFVEALDEQGSSHKTEDRETP